MMPNTGSGQLLFVVGRLGNFGGDDEHAASAKMVQPAPISSIDIDDILERYGSPANESEDLTRGATGPSALDGGVRREQPLSPDPGYKSCVLDPRLARRCFERAEGVRWCSCPKGSRVLP